MDAANAWYALRKGEKGGQSHGRPESCRIGRGDSICWRAEVDADDGRGAGGLADLFDGLGHVVPDEALVEVGDAKHQEQDGAAERD